jgi:hypothetical protein
MIYISADDKIMIKKLYEDEPKEITNETGLLPLCVHSNTILMSDYKLYAVNIGIFTDDTLHLIVMESKGDYVVGPNDFTDKFVQINCEYYIINNMYTLRKIMITPKNVYNVIFMGGIIRNEGYYCYVDANNRLLRCHARNLCISGESTLLDDDVDVDYILCCNKSSFSYNVICSKVNKIICYSYTSHSLKNFCTKNINYTGSRVIKIIDNYFLDSDDNLFKFTFDGNAVILMRISVARDFSTYGSDFLFLNSSNKILQLDFHCNYKYVDTDGCFKKTVTRIKSAALVCP